jgi:hypothetical protein
VVALVDYQQNAKLAGYLAVVVVAKVVAMSPEAVVVVEVR